MPRQKLSKKKGELDYGVFQEPLHNMFTSLSNRLEREWDPRYRHVDSSAVMFYQNFRNAINTYVTIFYVAGDFPKDPLRRPVFALSLPPLTRTLYEQLVMFLFLLEDIPAFVPYLFKTGYTEIRMELKHCLTYHGTEKRWKPYISTLKKRAKELEKLHALTTREIKDPLKTIGRGPTPGGLKNILRDNRPKSKIIPFIEYMNSWLCKYPLNSDH